jgi:hypothetical protein
MGANQLRREGAGLLSKPMECLYFLVIAERSINSMSCLGIVLILLNLPVLSTMTLGPRDRFKRGLIYTSLVFLLTLALQYYKVKGIRTLDTTFVDYEKYKKTYKGHFERSTFFVPPIQKTI